MACIYENYGAANLRVNSYVKHVYVYSSLDRTVYSSLDRTVYGFFVTIFKVTPILTVHILSATQLPVLFTINFTGCLFTVWGKESLG